MSSPESTTQGTSSPAEPNPEPKPQEGTAGAVASNGRRLPQPPPGYQFLRTQTPDGKTITVVKKIAVPGIDNSVSLARQERASEKHPSASEKAIFKVVAIKQEDGTVLKVRRRVYPTSGQTSPQTKTAIPPPANASAESNVTSCKPSSAETRPRCKSDARPSARQDADSTEKLVEPVEKKTDPAAIEPKLDSKPKSPEDLEAAVAEQRRHNRETRYRRFKGSIKQRFFSGLLGSSSALDVDIPDQLHHDGQTVDDSDLSAVESDGDDHDIGAHEPDHSDNSTENGIHGGDEKTGSHNHVTFNASRVVSSLVANGSTGPRRPPPAAAKSSEKGDPEKVQYKLSVTELDRIESEREKKDAERPLQRHWESFTFYFMASLSVVLPTLFLVLAVCIAVMNGRLLSSNWFIMQEVITAAISAWPIVFAAVVAQSLKSYATFKVERGVGLLELEQLIGTNSFGSAIKQPLLLRKLDVMAFLLFLIWCLSPIGSQALQRVYDVDLQQQTQNATAYYVDMTKENYLWGVNQNLSLSEADELVQAVAMYYIAGLTPPSFEATEQGTKSIADLYGHPIITPLLAPPADPRYAENGGVVAAYGVPMILPESKIADDLFSDYKVSSTHSNVKSIADPSEDIGFNIRTSYYQFACDPWETKNYSQLNDIAMAYSDTLTLMVNFSSSAGYGRGIDKLRFASRNGVVDATSPGLNSTRGYDDDWQFSYIECTFEQVFVQAAITCLIDPDTLLPYCYSRGSTQFNSTATQLADFSWPFAVTANPDSSVGSPRTPTEIYLQTGIELNGSYVDVETADLSMLTQEEFAVNFGYLFNTWVGLGYCPECTSFNNVTLMQHLSSRYTPVSAIQNWQVSQMYKTYPQWVGLFVACAAIMFLAGLASALVDSKTVAPDTLGYVSSVARNSRYLQLPKLSSAMSGSERAKKLRHVRVMMQDVKAGADVGKIALGMEHEGAERLKPGRLYR